MGNRRFVPTSDDEEDAPLRSRNTKGDENQNPRKRKKVHILDDDEDEKEMDEKLSELSIKKKTEDSEPEAAGEENDEQEDVEAVPLGEVVRVSGIGRGRKKHYSSFEYDGLQYELEDPVLLVPGNESQKPRVVIIKDISKKLDEQVMVEGQWFYRPEEVEIKGGGNWQSHDRRRELIYSFHRDEVPAESVMHKCVVHFIPQNKQIPRRKEHPGFIVQNVYDTEDMRLFKLTDKYYREDNQGEIDLLVQKTHARLGDLPDLEPGEPDAERDDRIKNKQLLRKRNMSPLDVSKEDEGLGRSQSLNPETPGSAGGTASEYFAILSKFKILTGETQRDKWLEKLLQSIQFMCTTPNGDASFDWPDAAVPAVAALEKAAHTLSQKYNQKMRTLTFNLQGNAVLARRLLNGELEPAQIVNMAPNELKEGLTGEEIARRQPEESVHMQMMDARCKRCSEKQVRLIDIIQAGRGDRYQLECLACGNTWYDSRNAVATLTIEGPSSKTVGAAPRGDTEKGANDVLKKTTEAYVPVLGKQKSSNKTRAEENPPTTK